MIYIDILASLEKALGTALDSDQRRRAVEVMAADMGGERYYLPHLPKLHRQRAVAAFGTTSMTVAQIAGETGIPARSIKRLRNGK